MIRLIKNPKSEKDLEYNLEQLAALPSGLISSSDFNALISVCRGLLLLIHNHRKYEQHERGTSNDN